MLKDLRVKGKDRHNTGCTKPFFIRVFKRVKISRSKIVTFSMTPFITDITKYSRSHILITHRAVWIRGSSSNSIGH